MLSRLLKLTTLLLIILAVTIPPMAHAQDDAPDEPMPLIVLIEFDPLVPNLIRQNPTFALYEDGTVIYRNELVAADATAEPSSDTGYRTLKLDEDALAAFMAGLNFDEFDGLRRVYRGLDLPDPIQNYIAMWSGAEFASTWVDGDLRNDQASRNLAPAEYLTIFDQLIAFVGAEHPEAQMWLPEQLKINVFANRNLPPEYRVAEPGDDWPSDWPGLDDPTSLFAGSWAIITLDASDYASAVEFIAVSNGAANIDGKTYWAILTLPLPNDREWWGDINQAY